MLRDWRDEFVGGREDREAYRAEMENLETAIKNASAAVLQKSNDPIERYRAHEELSTAEHNLARLKREGLERQRARSSKASNQLTRFPCPEKLEDQPCASPVARLSPSSAGLLPPGPVRCASCRAALPGTVASDESHVGEDSGSYVSSPSPC